MLRTTAGIVGLLAAALLAACGGGAAATPVPSPAPTNAPAITTPPAPTTLPTNAATGPANIDAPASIEAGKQFDVIWTGPNGDRDYITIVAPTATEWSNQPYFNTSDGSPGKLTAPATAGSYVLWYVRGVDGQILFKRDITVSPFVGALQAPASVVAGTQFQVSWNGPDGPGDYVTIVKKGAETWTNEPYFNTSSGNPGTLQAQIEAGDYEIWYVSGTGAAIQARIPITITPYSASVTAPANAGKGTRFDVQWTGPNGPGDYVTIVAAGAGEGTYASYCDTSQGPTCSLTAPEQAGPYEVRYVTAAGKTLATRAIVIQ